MKPAFILALVAATLASSAFGGEDLYLVTVRSEAAIDRLATIAEQFAATYGGSVVEVDAIGGTMLMRLPASRATTAGRDPRVQSIRPAGGARVATDATEVVPWGTGVTYSYDGAGNVTKIGSDEFVYDVASRLVQSKINNQTRNYEYDAFGNRTTCTPGCQGETIDGTTNRITGTNNHDAAGNVTRLDGHQYSYDALNMQIRDVDTTSGVIREYVYTADDERIAVYTVNQWWRWTIRDTSGKVLREYMSQGTQGTSNWQWAKDYVWRDGILLATRHVPPGGSSAVTYRYHVDHLGTPRRITDDSDRIVGFHDYFAFGPETTTGKTEPSLTVFKYTGHERDVVDTSLSGPLDYMHARYYSPGMGRFLSIDPVNSARAGIPQTWNRYVYARGNPLRYVDPNGERDYDILKVRVNVIYSNADRKLSSGTMRNVAEQGLIHARQILNNAGIALDFRRFEADLSPNRFHTGAEGTVRTSSGPVGIGNFLAAEKGKALTLIFMGDLNRGSSTDGPGTPAIFGVRLDADSAAHEIAHQLGNVLPVTGILANTATDTIYSAELLQLQLGIGFSQIFEGWLRTEAQKLNCPGGKIEGTSGPCD